MPKTSLTRKNVVISILGTTLDSGFTDARWTRWRPTVSLVGHAHLQVSKLELIHMGGDQSKLLAQVCDDIKAMAPTVEVEMHKVSVATENLWDFESMYSLLHDFATGYHFDDDTDYYVHISTGTHVAQICLFLLTESRYIPAKLIQTGPVAANAEPWRGRLDIIDLDLSRYGQIASRFNDVAVHEAQLLKGGIQSRNAEYNALIDRLERVAIRSTAPILITGPTGSGKTALAQRVYELRKRRNLVDGPLIEVNCATLRGDAAMSVLFGHTRGAFTGALSARKGLLVEANNGMLFLDEIAELGLDEQAMLLRALEDKMFRPMGSDRSVSSNFTLLAGTNKDLNAEVKAGRFREDLLARIQLWHFALPGLAERQEDIEPNLDYELRKVSDTLRSNVTITREARDLFVRKASAASWPGNFREFRAVITRMATLAINYRIDTADVEAEMPEQRLVSCSTGGELVKKVLPGVALDLFEEAQLEVVFQAIKECRTAAEAGRQLFKHSLIGRERANESDRLIKYLSRYGLRFSNVRALLIS